MYYEDNCIICVGLKEARRCSYLGELDSNEEESDEISEEFEFEHNTQADTHTMYDTTSVQNSRKQYPYFPSNILGTKPSTNNLTLGNFANKNEDVTDFVDAFNGLNQHSRNIIVNKLLESLGQSNKNINTKYDAERYLKFSAHQAPTKMEIAKIKKQDATNKMESKRNPDIILNTRIKISILILTKIHFFKKIRMSGWMEGKFLTMKLLMKRKIIKTMLVALKKRKVIFMI